MPVTISALKALRRDLKRTLINQRRKRKIKAAVKKARTTPNLKTVMLATSLLDKAAKKNIIHKNKAARLKSRIAKRLSSLQK